MPDNCYELEIKTRDAAGQESVFHAEYSTQATDTHAAIREVTNAITTQRGKGSVREIDTSK